MESEPYDAEYDLDELEESMLKTLEAVMYHFSKHKELSIGEALQSYKESHDADAVLRLVQCYFHFGGRLIGEGIEHGVFEPDEGSSWRSDESMVFNQTVVGALIGATRMGDGPRHVSGSTDVELAPFDASMLFERMIRDSVTHEEFQTYASRCDAEALREALVEHDEVINLKHTDNTNLPDTIGPDDDILSYYIDEDE